MQKNNDNIRQAAKDNGVFLWQVAERYGVSEAHFCRVMRKQLTEEQEARIMDIIAEIHAENQEDNE